ncbi:MAG: hypothetical protein DRO39_05390 [Thermoprotei archaeon]|nr:MAG: hypothetical protein DRO39_05390 [Thermoprotei archaeon]
MSEGCARTMEGLQEIKQLDPLLMNPKKLMIVALLYALGPRTMKQLVNSLGLTWGAETFIRVV